MDLLFSLPNRPKSKEWNSAQKPIGITQVSLSKSIQYLAPAQFDRRHFLLICFQYDATASTIQNNPTTLIPQKQNGNGLITTIDLTMHTRDHCTPRPPRAKGFRQPTKGRAPPGPITTFDQRSPSAMGGSRSRLHKSLPGLFGPPGPLATMLVAIFLRGQDKQQARGS